MEVFKVRSSMSGEIMPNSRKKGELSKSAKTYAETWLKEQIYGYKHEVSSKYMEKGIEVEDESIDYIAEELGYGFLSKNTMSYENDFLTGTPDLIVDGVVIDIKNSWSHWTLPLFDTEIPNKGYYYQLQCYMALCNLDKAKLIYTLMDTPTDILNAWTDVPYSYEDIESKYRIKVFDVERSDEDIDKIYERVAECREYIKTLNSKLNEPSSIKF